VAHTGEFLVPLIIRDGSSLIPTGETGVEPGDQLYVIADAEGTDTLFGAAGQHRRELRRIAIAGGGRIGRYVADYLLAGDGSMGGAWSRILGRFQKKKANRQVHFIENDYDKGQVLVEAYPQALVTHADISDEEVMEEGILEGYDLMIAATSNQELNLVASLHARNRGIPRTIALVRKGSYVAMGREMGIDVTVSVTDTMVDSILRILRKGNIRSVHSLAGSDFEVIDFALDENAALAGKAVKDVGLPKDSLILLITRGDRSFLPRGDHVIEAGDRIVLITPREAVKRLEEAVLGT
jgi:trk system potassium uptake protein TrkA